MLQIIETPIYRSHRTSIPPSGHDQLCMISYGRFVSGGRFRWEQVAPDACIHVITSGSGTFVTNGVSHEAVRGDLYMFYPGDHVRYYDRPETPWQYRWCGIAGPFAQVLSDCGIEKGRYLYKLRDLTAVVAALDQVEEACRNDEDARHLGSAALHVMLNDLNVRETVPMDMAHRAKAVIDSWSYDYPTVQDVADAVGVERTTLFRRFKAEFGMSVKQYVDECRLTKAARLLRMSNEPIKSIARSCGYWDQLYFSRAFSNRYGMSPSAWRESNMEIPTAEEAFARHMAKR